jgi:hypothetical protein
MLSVTIEGMVPTSSLPKLIAHWRREGEAMKHNKLVFGCLASCCLFASSITAVWASPEGWQPEWYQCQGFLKKWLATWHTHSLSGFPWKHLMHSNTQFGEYTEHSPPSPLYQKWNFCTGPLIDDEFYLFIDCYSEIPCLDCSNCRNSFAIFYIPHQYAYPCEPP